jgi:hypothetical protein
MGKYEDALNKYAKYVIQQSRSNLTKKGNSASGALYKSLGYEVTEDSISFTGESYGSFQDQGVRGKNAYYSASANSPFKFGTGTGQKYGLRRGIAKWIKQKGIKGRVNKNWKSAGNKGGQFISDKSLTFLISRSIYDKGIRATLFFTKPFEAGLVKYGGEIAAAYIEDNLNFEE